MLFSSDFKQTNWIQYVYIYIYYLVGHLPILTPPEVVVGVVLNYPSSWLMMNQNEQLLVPEVWHFQWKAVIGWYFHLYCCSLPEIYLQIYLSLYMWLTLLLVPLHWNHKIKKKFSFIFTNDNKEQGKQLWLKWHEILKVTTKWTISRKSPNMYMVIMWIAKANGTSIPPKDCSCEDL